MKFPHSVRVCWVLLCYPRWLQWHTVWIHIGSSLKSRTCTVKIKGLNILAVNKYKIMKSNIKRRYTGILEEILRCFLSCSSCRSWWIHTHAKWDSLVPSWKLTDCPAGNPYRAKPLHIYTTRWEGLKKTNCLYLHLGETLTAVIIPHWWDLHTLHEVTTISTFLDW